MQSYSRLVVIIPALNEQATIGDVIEAIPRDIPKVEEVCVVVVDDGSTDDTAEIAANAGAMVVKHPRNMGVGAAFSTGLEHALLIGADIIVNMDGDGQFQAADIEKLIKPITDQQFGFVTCSRFGDPDNLPVMPTIKYWGNMGMCRIINTITRSSFSDVSCGFRAYSRDTALRLNLFGRFTYTQESFIDLANKGIAMTEVPLVVRGEREFGKSRVASNLWKYAMRTSSIIIRALRDTKPLVFFGSISSLFLSIGILNFLFVTVWWLMTARTAPYTSLLTVGTFTSIIGMGIGVIALVSDQIARGRKIQEELLYFQRREYYAQHHMQPKSLATADAEADQAETEAVNS